MIDPHDLGFDDDDQQDDRDDEGTFAEVAEVETLEPLDDVRPRNWVPTPAEIAERCEAIRREWSEDDFQRRTCHGFRAVPWSVPGCGVGDSDDSGRPVHQGQGDDD